MRSFVNEEDQHANQMEASEDKEENRADDTSRPAESRKQADQTASPKRKKPMSFYLAFLALNISTVVVSLDATALAVAIPVSLISTTGYFRVSLTMSRK